MAVAVVQHVPALSSAGGIPSISFTTLPAANSYVTANVTTNSGTANSDAVADNQTPHNTFTEINTTEPFDLTGGNRCSAWQSFVGTRAGTYTVTLTPFGGQAAFQIMEISGADATTFTDGYTSAAGNSAAPVLSNLTPSADGGMLILFNNDWSSGALAVTYGAPLLVANEDAGANGFSADNHWVFGPTSGTAAVSPSITFNAGATESATIAYLVKAGAIPPVIVQPPASTTLNDNEYWYGWVISDHPGTDTYQWQQNTGSGWTNIVGQTSNYYTAATRLHVADSGIQYRCNVTNANGTTASAAATITVQAKRSATLGQWDLGLSIKTWW